MANLDNIASLGETSTFIRDFSTYNNNGTVGGGAIWTGNGKRNGAYQFDGVDDFISFGNDVKTDALSVQNMATYSLWVKINTCIPQQEMISQRDDSPYDGRGIYVQNNVIGFWSRNSAGTWQERRTTCIPNQWINLTLTQSGNVIAGYMNGSSIGSLDMGSSLASHYYSYFTIGKYTDVTNYFN